MDPSPAVHGPEVAFDSGDEDDDDSDSVEAYNAMKGKQRAFNLRNRAANKRDREEMRAKLTRRGFDHGQSLPLRCPAPQWCPASAPTVPVDLELDPPQVPGGRREAHMDFWPRPTDSVSAGPWSEYVPLDNAQCNDLLRSARAYNNSGAAQRVCDLLYQYDTNHELHAFGYIHKIKQVWSDPHRHRNLWTQPPPLWNRHDQHTRASHRRRVDDKTSRGANPGYDDLPSEWLQHWDLYPEMRPTCLPRLRDGPPFYREEHVRGHILLRRILPQLPTERSADCEHFIQIINKVFSIPGLYRSIIERGGYPSAEQEGFLPYPGLMSDVSIYDIASWYAHCGLKEESIELMVPIAIRHHHENERRNANSNEEFTEWPVRLDEVMSVPSYADLSWTSMQVPHVATKKTSPPPTPPPNLSNASSEGSSSYIVS